MLFPIKNTKKKWTQNFTSRTVNFFIWLKNLLCPEVKISHRDKKNVSHDFHFSTCFMKFPSRKTKKQKNVDQKFSMFRGQNLLLGQFFSHDFHFSTCFMPFPSEKTKKKKMTENFLSPEVKIFY